MRIGTWNLQGRWGPQHRDFVSQQDCDVWLLTRVPDRLVLADHVVHPGGASLGARKTWAAILSRRTTEPLPDPSPTSAAAVVAGLTVVCTALGEDAAGSSALRLLAAGLPRTGLVWGGALGEPRLDEPGHSGQLATTASGLGLQVPTAPLPHRWPGRLTVDQIAVPRNATVLSAHRLAAVADNQRLSDHDAYVVEIVPGEHV